MALPNFPSGGKQGEDEYFATLRLSTGPGRKHWKQAQGVLKYLKHHVDSNPSTMVRQRLAIQIWRDYQDHINARIRYADPDEDDKRRHEEEAQASAQDQELAARRLFNEAYLQRMGRPQAFGLC